VFLANNNGIPAEFYLASKDPLSTISSLPVPLTAEKMESQPFSFQHTLWSFEWIIYVIGAPTTILLLIIMDIENLRLYVIGTPTILIQFHIMDIELQ
jgi:hypothetical protein